MDPVERREDVFAWKQPMCLGHVLTSVDFFSVGNRHGIFRHRSKPYRSYSWRSMAALAVVTVIVCARYRIGCHGRSRVADQWCDHLPVGRDRCAVPLLQLRNRDIYVKNTKERQDNMADVKTQGRESCFRSDRRNFKVCGTGMKRIGKAFFKAGGSVRKIYGKYVSKESYDVARRMIREPDSKWMQYVNRILNEVDPHVIKNVCAGLWL